MYMGLLLQFADELKYESATELCRLLHWLPVRQRVDYKSHSSLSRHDALAARSRTT